MVFAGALAVAAVPTAADDAYAPTVRDTHPDTVYWGDTHVHTYLSGDAFGMGNRTTPDTAYRFAKGEEVVSAGGKRVRLRRPLDFLMVLRPCREPRHPATAHGGRRAVAHHRRWPDLAQVLRRSRSARRGAGCRKPRRLRCPLGGVDGREAGLERGLRGRHGVQAGGLARRHRRGRAPQRSRRVHYLRGIRIQQQSADAAPQRPVCRGSRANAANPAVLQTRQCEPRGSVGLPRRIRSPHGQRRHLDPAQQQLEPRRDVRRHDPRRRPRHRSIRHPARRPGTRRGDHADQRRQRDPSARFARRSLRGFRDLGRQQQGQERHGRRLGWPVPTSARRSSGVWVSMPRSGSIHSNSA